MTAHNPDRTKPDRVDAVLVPLSRPEVHDLRVRAADTRAIAPDGMDQGVARALAALYEAHAELGDALAGATEPSILIVRDLPG